ncbi:hypothetical protein H2198_003567 [Neophaeococcomyces mojaviensis]|uniref:Uncharacterized protein n=1 Tax=Neophaeococcomyces mojaviensis TaxID=3383035 RepID=A0ACC3AB24_9EURO|nr:hypothetical protein H2198_003567 [Knufia sp. JES_112]
MSGTPNAPIILFHYPFSPWSQKITAYLSLRGIAYTSCHQPVTLPRPNLNALGVKYRRIPVLSIGRDVYCDTLLMLEKLEQLYPVSENVPGISATHPKDKALERLLEKWTDVVVFKYAAAAIPTSFPIMSDKNFIDDRQALWGREWTKDHQDSLRAEALVVLRSNMEFLENDLLSDGQDFINGHSPTLSDIHAGWIFTWLADMPGALDDHIFSQKLFPKTYAWFERYKAVIAKAVKDMEASGSVRQLDGDAAVKEILEGPFGEKQVWVDQQDPTGLKEGDYVNGWPTDTGFSHRDSGNLVGLTTQEVIISSKASNGAEVRVHHPRWNFAVEKMEANGA